MIVIPGLLMAVAGFMLLLVMLSFIWRVLVGCFYFLQVVMGAFIIVAVVWFIYNHVQLVIR